MTPERSPGGHRQYSDDDVRLLLALRQRVEGGERIGKVIKLGKEAILANAGTVDTAAEDALNYQQIADAVVRHARANDSEAVGRLLDRPLLQRHGVEVALNLFLPILRAVGELWHSGEIDIAVEHMVERHISSRLHAVILNRRAPKDGPIAVLACLPGERHEVGLLTAALILVEAGFGLNYLGADLPIADLTRVVTEVRPRVVALSAMLVPKEKDLEALFAAYQTAAFKQASILVGGGSADLLCRDHASVVPLTGLSAVAQQLANAS